MKRILILAAWLAAGPAGASLPPADGDACVAGACVEAVDAPLGSVDIKVHNKEAQHVLNAALADDGFWQEASSSTYNNQLYDQIRLKDTDNGYVPMITGEGDDDFPAEVVADIVYRRNSDLPRYMSGCENVVYLGSGFDSTIGAEYRDSFYLLDFTMFFGYFSQRMYRRYDEDRKQWVMWFEKLDESWVGSAKFAAYQTKIESILEAHDGRWLFGGYKEVTDVYGMFVVTPGAARESRVTFVSKLTFGEGSGFIAKVGSQMPGVIKSGLKAGFDACVLLAKDEKKKRMANSGG